MIFLIVMACFFFYLGIRNIIHFVVLFSRRKQCQNWPYTRGKIIRSELKSQLMRTRHNIDGAFGMRMVYYPDILYTYRVHAEAFESNQIFFGQSSSSNIDYANDLVDKYPQGKDILVYYNPEKPEMAILKRNKKQGILIYLVGGLVSTFIGFMFLGQAIILM